MISISTVTNQEVNKKIRNFIPVSTTPSSELKITLEIGETET